MFNAFSYYSSNNWYLLTSPIVIPGTNSNEFNILSFVVENDTTIKSHNTLFEVKNNTCSKKNNSTSGLTLNDLSVYTSGNGSNVSTF